MLLSINDCLADCLALHGLQSERLKEIDKIIWVLTCCDSRVSDVSGVIPQADSSTTTLDVGMAWVDLSEVQVRMRERIKELRCILRV